MSKRAIFWGSLGVLVYAYAGFPLLVAARALVRNRPIKVGDGFPNVTVVIPAYNEVGIIAEKLDNVLSLGYPPERLEIIVASDGSDDGTNDVVRAHWADVRLLPLPRVGKNAALNEAAAATRGEILVFTDADAKMTEHTLHYIVAPFGDPEVGGVAGERRHGEVSSPKGLAAAGKRLFRELLSRSGSATSAEGQIYAVRRELFQPAPRNVPDDFWISTRVVALHSRLVYEPRAILWHPHRLDLPGLSRQIHRYGVGLSAALPHIPSREPPASATRSSARSAWQARRSAPSGSLATS